VQQSTTTPSTTTAPPSTSSTVTTVTPPPGISACEGRYNEYVEHPLYCALYIYCYLEMEFLMQCPQFQIFDVERQTCRYGNQETCDFLEEPTEPTTLSTVTTQPPTTPIFDPCADVQNGVVADPEDCAGYFLCINYIAVPSKCPEGEIFVPERTSCEEGDSETCEPHSNLRSAWNPSITLPKIVYL